MLKNYENFLTELDMKLKEYFEFHSSYICCKLSCSGCCEVGDYPFSFLEMKYLMKGFMSLDEHTKRVIRNKIESLKKQIKGSNSYYECPFLIDKKCSVYKYRGITCRTFGLAYLVSDKLTDDGTPYVKLPECVKHGMNYSMLYDNGTVDIAPINDNLDLPAVINSDLAKKYGLVFGELKSLINWFS